MIERTTRTETLTDISVTIIGENGEHYTYDLSPQVENPKEEETTDYLETLDSATAQQIISDLESQKTTPNKSSWHTTAVVGLQVGTLFGFSFFASTTERHDETVQTVEKACAAGFIGAVIFGAVFGIREFMYRSSVRAHNASNSIIDEEIALVSANTTKATPVIESIQ